MRTYLLAPVLILLLALLPGCAAKKSAPSWPWKEGDEVRAELVSSDWGMGDMNYVLVTPDNKWIYIASTGGMDCDEEDGGEGCESLTSEGVMETEGLLFDENLGLPMLITIEKNITIFDDPDGIMFYVKASKVRREPDPKTPRYTRLLPNQELTGTIICDESAAEDTVHIVVGGKKIRVYPRQGEPLREFMYFCHPRTGKVTIEGEFFFESNEIDYFRTWTSLRNQ